MAKICPSCGFSVDDDTALFCNKCGFPFPQQRQRSSPYGVVSSPAAGPTPAEPRPPLPLRRHHTDRSGGINAFLSFDTLIIGRYLKLVYVVGAVLIILVSLAGITGGFAVKGEVPGNMSFTNTSAVVQHSGSSPLFWIGFLVAGSLLWRMVCEIFAVLLRTGESGSRGNGIPEEEEEAEEVYTEEVPAAPAQYVTCPKCGKTVTTDELRECEHCGIQGCTNCIRSMGLLKKTLTCRECFEGK